MPDSASSEQTEKGSDELLLEITDDHKIMRGVFLDDDKRATEERLMSLQPTDGNLG